MDRAYVPDSINLRPTSTVAEFRLGSRSHPRSPSALLPASDQSAPRSRHCTWLAPVPARAFATSRPWLDCSSARLPGALTPAPLAPGNASIPVWLVDN